MSCHTGAEMKVETCLDMFQFLAIFGGAPALSCTHVFPKKVTPNGHSPTNFCILNVSNFWLMSHTETFVLNTLLASWTRHGNRFVSKLNFNTSRFKQPPFIVAMSQCYVLTLSAVVVIIAFEYQNL
jgi:hypothetical protein